MQTKKEALPYQKEVLLSFLVEARGIEPLSEDLATCASTSVVVSFGVSPD